MIESELINKAKEYLNTSDLQPINDEISYTGIRKDAPQLDGSVKDMHIITFVLEFDKESPFGTEICAIYADAETFELEIFITPYEMKHIQVSS